MRTTLHERVQHMRTLNLEGGHPALDLANTVDWRYTEHPVEWLGDYTAVVAWAIRTGLLAENEAAAVLTAVSCSAGQAEETYYRIILFRESIHGLFSAVATRKRTAPTELDELNRWLSRAMASSSIERSPSGFVWTFDRARTLEWFLYPVIKSTAELLSEGPLDRIKQCATPECGWLFLDSSKNNSRKWCSMQSCGNRAKARRHYHKHSDR